MNFRLVKAELRRMGRKNLFKILMSQKESKCLLNGLCSYHFDYKGYTFCLSEILGEGCESEKLKKLEEEASEREDVQVLPENEEPPLFDRMRESFYNFIKGKKSEI